MRNSPNPRQTPPDENRRQPPPQPFRPQPAPNTDSQNWLSPNPPSPHSHSRLRPRPRTKENRRLAESRIHSRLQNPNPTPAPPFSREIPTDAAPQRLPHSHPCSQPFSFPAPPAPSVESSANSTASPNTGNGAFISSNAASRTPPSARQAESPSAAPGRSPLCESKYEDESLTLCPSSRRSSPCGPQRVFQI